MKHFIILFFAFTLILKTSISFASKHSFNHQENITLSEQQNFQKNSKHSDCHNSDKDKEPSNQTHCEGVCLCSHFSNTLNFMINSCNNKTKDFITDRSILHTGFFILSFINSPPKKPPKKII